ncbi:MAG: AmpG family muropeptide MFS transporter [Proteobacteria bacterium]|nr:AmpG family muropeptide MFS transporter [Pseudomonadota bacterium]
MAHHYQYISSIDKAIERGAIIALMNYLTRPLLTILFLGFASGLPLALTASTLSAWLFEAHVDKSAIGLFAAVATPYTLKFLWSPLMDSLRFPLLTRLFGRRRGWILATQIALVGNLLLLAVATPDINAWTTACVAFLVSFFSASQDIVIDAYRVETLAPEEQGEGAAMAQLGYRLGMLASSAGALYLAAKLGWQATYVIMSALMGIGIITTLLAREPKIKQDRGQKAKGFGAWLRESVIAPFIDFMRHPSWKQILAFIVIYRLADAFIGGMTNPFLLEIGFKKEEISSIVKVYGTIATLLGTFVGGSLTMRYGVLRVIFLAGLLHAATNLCYVWQAHVGADNIILAVSTSLENLTGGIAAAAFVAYLSNLCNVHYTATQYALLSSLAALGRTLFSTPAGYIAKQLGWDWFFTLSALLALPGLLLIGTLGRRLVMPRPGTKIAPVRFWKNR